MLREFLLRGGGDGDVAAKHDGARGCGALIDGQHKGHGVSLALLPGRLLVAARQADWEWNVNMDARSRSLARLREDGAAVRPR